MKKLIFSIWAIALLIIAGTLTVFASKTNSDTQSNQQLAPQTQTKLINIADKALTKREAKQTRIVYVGKVVRHHQKFYLPAGIKRQTGKRVSTKPDSICNFFINESFKLKAISKKLSKIS